jgi:hypothetical protein
MSDVVAVALIFAFVTVLVVGMVVGVPVKTRLGPKGFWFDARPQEKPPPRDPNTQ